MQKKHNTKSQLTLPESEKEVEGLMLPEEVGKHLTLPELGKHLTLPERRILENRNLRGWTKAAIARDLEKHRSTICRELNDEKNWDHIRLRNGKVKKAYSAVKAQKNYEAAKKKCGAKLKYTKNPKLLPEIEKRFFESNSNLKNKNDPKTRYSLDAIIGRMELEGTKVFTSKTMYNYIEKGNITKITKFDLPRILGRKRNKKKIDKTNKRILGTSIEQRPERINNREEFGHFEGDTIVDGSHNAILAKTERLSRLFVLRKLPRHNSEEVEKAEAKLNAELFQRSTTYDNGSEFYKRVEHDCEDFKSYFTHAGAPYEKGGTENNNGIARRHWPKGTNLADIPDEEIQQVEDHINNMPRKILGYRTAREVYNTELEKVSAKNKAA